MIASAISATVGACISSVLACIPGLHIYNIFAALLLVANYDRLGLPVQIVLPFALGMTVGYAMLNVIPSVLLAAPDESTVFTVLPGQKYLMDGRGYEAAIVTFMGGLTGLVFLLLIMGPLAPHLLPAAVTIFRPHLHWIVWCVICFMLMSEWPKSGRLGDAGGRKLFNAWKSTGMGLVTFLLSGVLGFILMYRSPLTPNAAFQNFMPAFVGLFTLPRLILNIVCRVEPPSQRSHVGERLNGADLLHGSLAGALGGSFAAFIPAVTGGVGAMLAGHATAMRNDRAFLVSQGTSKLVYYVGAILLFCVPGPALARGGAAAMLRSLCPPRTHSDYYLALASVALAGAVCCVLIRPLTRGMIHLISRAGYRTVSCAALVSVLVIVAAVTGVPGVCVACVATGIGLMPVVFGSRRMNCLGVILLPIACNMSGVGPSVASWLKLL